jgi:antitoxin HigA-1
MSTSIPATKNGMRPIHPGEILREEYLVPLRMSANAFAQKVGVPANRISYILSEERAITADTALRLARALGTSAQFWLNLQQLYDLRRAERDRRTAAAVRKIKLLAELAPFGLVAVDHAPSLRSGSDVRPSARRSLASASSK